MERVLDWAACALMVSCNSRLNRGVADDPMGSAKVVEIFASVSAAAFYILEVLVASAIA